VAAVFSKRSRTGTHNGISGQEAEDRKKRKGAFHVERGNSNKLVKRGNKKDGFMTKRKEISSEVAGSYPVVQIGEGY